ncbi:MAG: GTP cyclohydrolase I FolE [Dehalococcoidia bacterium]|jgi:GTP cyclohydrolase I
MSTKEIPTDLSTAKFDFEDGALIGAACKQVIADGVVSMLQAIGGGVDAQGTADTPKRVANMYDELLSGYSTDPVELLNGAMFDVEYDEMVVVKDIDFYSLCEHHLLPFYGKAHVGYLPNNKVIGLSKIPRMVEMFARRLQVQERMTQQIALTLDELIQPAGIGVVVEAQHFCAAMRGVRKPNTTMTTSALRGQFKKNPSTREEFFSHVRQ